MREPERRFTIYYFSEVSAEISLIRSEGLAGAGSIVAKAHHPSGTGMQNWFHFTDDEDVPHHLRNADNVRAAADIGDCESEREAILQCLANLAEKLWHGLDWKVEQEDFDKETFYKDLLQAFIVGEWTVQYGRVSDDALPPKHLSERIP